MGDIIKAWVYEITILGKYIVYMKELESKLEEEDEKKRKEQGKKEAALAK